MKSSLLLILTVFVLSACSKDGNIVEVPPPPSPGTPPDSAQMIYVTATDRARVSMLYAFGANGQERWKTTTRSETGRGLTINDGMLYMDDGYNLFAVNALTGLAKWTVPSASAVVRPRIYGDSLVSAPSFLSNSSNNQVVIYNKNTGDPIWNVVVRDQPLVTPAISDGKVFCLTTNTTGTQLYIAAYSLATRAEIWKKTLANGFLMQNLPEMIIRGDTLIVGAFVSSVTLLNKNTGDVFWSKGFNSTESFLIDNEIAYVDEYCQCVTKISLSSGATTFQGQGRIRTTYGNPLSYVYNNHLYTLVSDSLFRTNLADGVLQRSKIKFRYYTKLIAVGNTVYAANPEADANDKTRVMILRADNLDVKDSIVVPKYNMGGMSVLSTSNRFYQ